ncbi:MAG: transglycosylase SLT domain-containing protein [Gracilimonas sp.]|uniref:transglycosylase SLT domain-containing protein n=1 Tax=Gracilimonas sp. TaxID=1974203 RepID=UPI0019C898F9|nr:transglycosylase SLT domain-containing protein [Gracilimonas sp.]MBD3617710.1 transglycosylase SLT domain-containing protein [Gracilimonas sp.]
MSSALSISSQLSYLRVKGIMGHFYEASRANNVPVSLLLAIASRESHMGLALDDNWTGDNGNGIGIMQIDRRYHSEFTNAHANNDHRANIHYGSKFLADLIGKFGGKLTPAVAAYNAGYSKVRNTISAGIDPNLVTTGQNYASDVLRRKEIVESVMGISKASTASMVILPLIITGFISYQIFNTQ